MRRPLSPGGEEIASGSRSRRTMQHSRRTFITAMPAFQRVGCPTQLEAIASARLPIAPARRITIGGIGIRPANPPIFDEGLALIHISHQHNPEALLGTLPIQSEWRKV